MEDFAPIHHVITLKEADSSLFFTLDFELIEVQYPSKLIQMRGFALLDFWNAMVKIACDATGKEQRIVFAHRYGTTDRFGETIWEYISETDNGQWLYFVESKTHFWPRFYNSKEIEAAATDYKCRVNTKVPSNVKAEVFWQFTRVLEYVRKQGLTKIHSVHDVDNKVTENLMSLLTQKIDGNTTGTSKTPRRNYAQARHGQDQC